MAQPPPGRRGRQLCDPAPVGEIGQYAEHRPYSERNSCQRRGRRGAVDGEDDERGKKRADDGRQQAPERSGEFAAAPRQHGSDHHRDNGWHQNRHEGRIEELWPYRQFDPAPYLGEQRVEGAEKNRRHAGAEQQVVEDQGAFAAYGSKRVAGFETGSAQRVE